MMSPQFALTPPSSAPLIGQSTPDRESDFNIVCRGGVYGAETRLGFRQILEQNGPLASEVAVAIEMDKKSDPKQQQQIIDAVTIILSKSFIDIATKVPDFHQVPNPEKTILYLTAQPTTEGSLHLMREIKDLFQRENQSENLRPVHPEMIGVVPSLSDTSFPQNIHIPNTASAHPVNIAAESLCSTLKSEEVLPHWRLLAQWGALETITAKALLILEDKENIADSLTYFLESIDKHASTIPMDRTQRNNVIVKFVALASEFSNHFSEALA